MSLYPPSPVLKRKCDRQLEKCIFASLYTVTVTVNRWLCDSLNVQRSLQNEQGDNLEQSKNTFSTFFFSFCTQWSKAGGWCRSTRCWTELSAYLTFFNLAFKSTIDICVHQPPWRLGNDSQHLFGDWTLRVPPAALLIGAFFFFFFYCRSHNESGPNPLPPIWKFFRLSAVCELLRWPLTVVEIFLFNLRRTKKKFLFPVAKVEDGRVGRSVQTFFFGA